MKICVYWEYYQHYHCARVRSLLKVATDYNATLYPVCLCSSSNDSHRANLDNDLVGEVKVLEDGSVEDPMNQEKVVQMMVKYISDNKIDTVFVMGWSSRLSQRLAKMGKRKGYRVVLMLEGNRHDCQRRVWREFYKRMFLRNWIDSVFCGGTSHRDYAISLGVPSSKVLTGYDAIDNDYWEQLVIEGAKESPVGLRKGEKCFVASGRFIEKKNFSGLIDSYFKYTQEMAGEGCKLVLIGDGELRDSLKDKVREYDLEERVFFPGYQDPKGVAQYFAQALAFIMPSSHYEQWGLVVNEAMAAGLPVVVSDICGCVRDLVKSGENGFQFPAGDADALARILVDISNSDANDLSAMGRRSLEIVKGHGLTQFAHNFYRSAVCAHN